MLAMIYTFQIHKTTKEIPQGYLTYYMNCDQRKDMLENLVQSAIYFEKNLKEKKASCSLLPGNCGFLVFPFLITMPAAKEVY